METESPGGGGGGADPGIGIGNNGNDDWNKKLLENLLHSKSDRLAIKVNGKGKNPFIWSHFNIAYVDGVEQKYACCKFCNTFIKYTGRTGTGGLVRHCCFRKLQQEKLGQRLRPKPSPRFDQDRLKLAKSAILRMNLEDLLHQNSPRIGFVHNAKGKSYIWSQFRIVTVDDMLTQFACCIVCRSIVAYTGRTGTGGMTRHKCRGGNHADGEMREPVADPIGLVTIKSEEDDQEAEAFRWEDDGNGGIPDGRTTPPVPCKTERDDRDEGSGSPRDRLAVPPEVEEVLRQKHLALLNKSLRLFDVFENEEFLELAQFLVNLGARYGPMDVKTMFKREVNLVTLNGE